MPVRVSVGTSYADGRHIAAWVLAGLAFIISFICLVAAQHVTSATVLAAIAVVFVLLAVGLRFVIAKGRRFMTATQDGFLLENRHGEFRFADADITDLGTWDEVRYANGQANGITRTGALLLRANEFSSRLEFKYDFGLNEEDPLGTFIERNMDRLTEAASEALAGGREVSGDDWVLDRDGLTYAQKGEGCTVGLADLTAVDIVDGNVCVWRQGEPLPAVKVPAASPNAVILAKVLTKKLAGRPAGDGEDDGTLGRVIFERDSSLTATVLVLLAVLAVLLGVGGVALFWGGMRPGQKEPGISFITGGGLFLLAVILALVAVFKRVNVFRCHLFGVSRTTNGGEVSIRFKDVRVFTYSGVRNYVNGMYQGTQLALKFEGLKGQVLNYAALVTNADEELDNLREHVSRVLAGHMLKKLKDGRPVPWTDRVRFTEKGLEIAGKSGLFSKGDDLFVPYGEIADATLEAGNFALFAEGREKPVYETTAATPNFFPGYALLLLIRFPPKDDPKPRRPDDSDPEDFKKKPRGGDND